MLGLVREGEGWPDGVPKSRGFLGSVRVDGEPASLQRKIFENW